MVQLTSAKLGKVMEYVINPKIENKDFDYCVNQVIIFWVTEVFFPLLVKINCQK